MRVLRFSFALALACTALAAAGRAPVISQALQPEGPQGERLRPPATLNCSRNDLTSFTGRVLSYARSGRSLSLRLRTDEETTEHFTLRFKAGENPARWFLLRAEAFKPEDWKLIEARRGRLRPGMRATVWFCRNQGQPVIDWQPPESSGSFRLQNP